MSSTDKPETITGGCVCASVRYTVTFPPDHDFTNSVSFQPRVIRYVYKMHSHIYSHVFTVHYMPMRAVPQKHRLPHLPLPQAAQVRRRVHGQLDAQDLLGHASLRARLLHKLRQLSLLAARQPRLHLPHRRLLRRAGSRAIRASLDGGQATFVLREGGAWRYGSLGGGQVCTRR